MTGYLSVWRDTNSATTKSDILDLVIALSERCPWHLAKPILEANGVPTGHGWERTIEEINLYDQFPKVDIDGLYMSFVHHVCVGEKSVRFFDVGEAQADALRAHFQANAQLITLSRPKSKASLKKGKASPPSLDLVLQTPGGIFGVYSAIIRKEEKVPINLNVLTDGAKAALSDVEQIFAVRPSLRQQYGTIWVPNDASTVEVRVDFEALSSQREVGEFHQQMYSILHRASGSTSVISPLYLMTAVKNLYDANGEGTVTELSFSTTTGSLKTERMRASTCLRNETFHVGGKAALKTDIEPYRIGLNWLLPVQGTKDFANPSLLLEGNQNDGQALLSATVRKATHAWHYDWVRDKLLEYL